MSMDYTTLSVADQLLLARDLLRAKESDHYRLSLVDEPNVSARTEQLETQIKELRKKVEDLEKQTDEDDSEEKPKTTRRRTSGTKK